MRFFKIPGLSVIWCFLFGCSVLDFRGIEVSTFPDTPGQVVPREEPITIRFSEPVERESTEALISIFGPGEETAGTFTWEDELRVQFTPFNDLAPCTRYILSLEGTLYGVSGKTEEISLTLPFYVDSDGPGLVLKQSSPEHGSIVSRKTILEFVFSLYPALSGALYRISGTTSVFEPYQGFVMNTRYRISISTVLKDPSGQPLSSPVDLWFVPDIPGGALGLQNQDGSFLPETVSLYIRGAIR